jgi:hypothetical protein
MLKYRVLWLEDESNKMDGFFDKAYGKEIELVLVETFFELKETITRNPKLYYDAIILDGLGVLESIEEKPTLKALNESITFVNQHQSIEVIPYFILSGYLGEDEYNSVREMIGSENIYYKTIDEERLINDLKDSVDQKPEAQLKYKYNKLFDLCSIDYLGKDQFSRLFSIIKNIENGERLSNSEDMLTPLRKIVERIFERLRDIGAIPDQILKNKGWINGCSHFISNNHAEYNHLTEFIPPIIGENFYRLLNITHDASHVGGTLKLKSDQYIQSANSDYLYRSCVYLLFDIMLWFKDFVDSNNDPEENKSRWESNEWITGTVTRIAENSWGTFQPENNSTTIGIPPKIVQDHSLIENEKIKVTTKPSPDGAKTFIKAISREI